MSSSDPVRPSARYVPEQPLFSRSGGRWFIARDTATGGSALCIEVPLDASARTVFQLSNDAFSPWPAFSPPIGVEETEGGTTIIAYAEPSSQAVEAVQAAPLSEEETLAVAFEVLDLLEVAHQRGIVHPGIDTAALMVVFDAREHRPRAILRGLGLPAGARASRDDLGDLARCLARLHTMSGGETSSVRWEETRLGRVLQRAFDDASAATARSLRDELAPRGPRRGGRVGKRTERFASSGRVQSDLIAAEQHQADDLSATQTDVATMASALSAPPPRARRAWQLSRPRVTIVAIAAAALLVGLRLGHASSEADGRDGTESEAMTSVLLPTTPLAAPKVAMMGSARAVRAEPTPAAVTPVVAPGSLAAPVIAPAPPPTISEEPSGARERVVSREARKDGDRAGAAGELSPSRALSEPRISRGATAIATAPTLGSAPAVTLAVVPATPRDVTPAAVPGPAPVMASEASVEVAAAAPVVAAPADAAPPMLAATVATSPVEPAAPAPAKDAPVDPLAVLPFGPGMNRPQRLAGRDPLYTPQALALKSEGAMIVRCVIEPDGRATACRVLKSLPGMDEAVLAAFATHRYTPVLHGGKPARVSYTFNFRIEAP